jgi:hypothetical protein
MGIDASEKTKEHDGSIYAVLGGHEGVYLVYKEQDIYISIRDWERELVYRDQQWWQGK